MPTLVLKDRVKVASTSTGTGDFALGAASTGYQSFSVIGDGNQTYYCIATQGGTQWEVGIGTYTSSGDLLSRDTVLSSSAGGTTKVDFTSGNKDVFVTYPSEKGVWLDAAGNVVQYNFVDLSVTGTATIADASLTTGTISTTPASATDITNKQYVDTLVAFGITYHTPVKYEVPLINLNATYNQPGGAGVGVGATLTNAGTQTAFTPDGTVASAGDRILVYNQTNAYENGVYTVTTVGSGSTNWVLTRATDADSYGLKDPNALGQGDAFFVTSGSTGAGETYVCNTAGTITFGSTAIDFVQISDTQIYSAGTGLTLSGTQFSLSNQGTSGTYGNAATVPVITTNGQGQVTSVTDTAIAIDGSQITSGTVAITNGGTGQTSKTAAFDALSPITTEGDLIVGNNTGSSVRLPIGAAGEVLTSDGTTVSWAAGGGGSSGAILFNDVEITTNVTFAAGKNGLSVGPIMIDSGVSVTVPNGQRWIVL